MTALQRRLLFDVILKDARGKPCPCCQERNEMDARSFEDGPARDGLKAFQKAFGETIIGSEATVAFRLVPVERGVAKRGEDFFYLLPNLIPCCTMECRVLYQKMWEYHPDRQKFIDELVALQAGSSGKKRIKVTGGRIK